MERYHYWYFASDVICRFGRGEEVDVQLKQVEWKCGVWRSRIAARLGASPERIWGKGLDLLTSDSLVESGRMCHVLYTKAQHLRHRCSELRANGRECMKLTDLSRRCTEYAILIYHLYPTTVNNYSPLGLMQNPNRPPRLFPPVIHGGRGLLLQPTLIL